MAEQALAAREADVKKKLGTALEEDLIRRAKVMAVEEGKPLQRVLEEALEEYLKRHARPGRPSVVEATWGIGRAPRELVNAVVREEPSATETIPGEHGRSLRGSLARYATRPLPTGAAWAKVREKAWAAMACEKLDLGRGHDGPA